MVGWCMVGWCMVGWCMGSRLVYGVQASVWWVYGVQAGVGV